MEELRCFNNKDFQDIFYRAIIWPLSKEEKIKKTINGWDWPKESDERWNSLIAKENTWYKKNGYIDVIYDSERKLFLRKKGSRGRPSLEKDKVKSRKISFRLDFNLSGIIDNYCKKYKVDESEAIRRAILKLR